jgi:hypothetical protein
VLKSCKGNTCTDPWRVLHPSGDVTSLSAAVKVKFDHFYKVQPKVSFTKCEMGYLVESEGPQFASVYRKAAPELEAREVSSQRVISKSKEDQHFYGKERWSDWT